MKSECCEESFNTMAATIQASQDELRDAKEYLEGMVENSADIIITVNSEGLIETFNRGGEKRPSVTVARR